MSQIEIPEVKEVDPIEKERTRIAEMLFKEAPFMSAKYKTMIGHTGSMLTGSMTFAYSKAINDVINLILKENNK